MKFNKVLSVVNIVTGSIKGYPKRRKARGLYKQWAERSGLQPDIPPAEDAEVKVATRQAVAAGSVTGKSDESRQGYRQSTDRNGVEPGQRFRVLDPPLWQHRERPSR